MAGFSEQLIAARKAAGMTQEELASAVHVTRTTISSWERGRTRPDVESLQLLSQSLHWDFLANKSTVTETTAAHAEEAATSGMGAAAPSAEKKRRNKWTIAAVCGAVVLLVTCFLLFILPTLNAKPVNLPPAGALNPSDLHPEEPEVFTPEWFQGGNLRGKREPWLDIKTQVLVNTDNQTEPFWRYYLTFEEVAGYRFHFDQLDWFAFWALDKCEHRSFKAASGAVYEDDNGKYWEFIGGNPVQDMVGYGFIIYGHDDAGNKMSFRTFIDMTQAPRE